VYLAWYQAWYTAFRSGQSVTKKERRKSLTRRLTGCAKGSSATFLQCETGTVPSKFTAHRRVVQYWLHVSHDSWFAPLLSDFRGQGPTRRLQNTAALYGFTRTTELSGGRTYPTSKEVWHKGVRDAVADAAARFLQAKAVERKLPGPAVVAKRNNLLKLVAQPYVPEGADLAKYGVAFRQSAVSGRFREWDPRHCRPCPHCSVPGHFADPCHLLQCDKAPSALLAARTAVLSGVAALDARGHLGKASQVPALRTVCPPLQRSRRWVVGASGWVRVDVASRDALALVKKLSSKPSRLCVTRAFVCPSCPRVSVCAFSLDSWVAFDWPPFLFSCASAKHW
jgi:hypothetical protein